MSEGWRAREPNIYYSWRMIQNTVIIVCKAAPMCQGTSQCTDLGTKSFLSPLLDTSVNSVCINRDIFPSRCSTDANVSVRNRPCVWPTVDVATWSRRVWAPASRHATFREGMLPLAETKVTKWRHYLSCIICSVHLIAVAEGKERGREKVRTSNHPNYRIGSSRPPWPWARQRAATENE